MALAERGIAVNGDLERPLADPRPFAPETSRRIGESGAFVAGRQAEGRVTHARESNARHGFGATRGLTPGTAGRTATMNPMQPSPGAQPGPGERRRLDHPPSDRYRDAPPTTIEAEPDEEAAAPPTDAERLVRGIGVGLVGILVFALLGGPLSVTFGLIAAAGAIGWLIGLVARPMRAAAVAIALASVGLGLVAIWLYAGIEGGVLPIVEYLAEVQGVLVPLELAAAGGLAFAAAGNRA